MTEEAARAALANGTVVRWRNRDHSQDARKVREGRITSLSARVHSNEALIARVTPCGSDAISDYVRVENLR